MPFLHKDTPALDLLSDVLSGRTGRLYKGLVLGKDLGAYYKDLTDPRIESALALVHQHQGPAQLQREGDLRHATAATVRARQDPQPSLVMLPRPLPIQ